MIDTGPVCVRVASRDDSPGARAVLVAAFADEPFVRWFVRSDAERGRAMERYFDIMVDRMIAHGGLFVAETASETGRSVLGAAVWAPPGKWELSAIEQLRLLPEMLFIVGPDRLTRIAKKLAVVERNRPAEPSYFLALVGTHPSAQRRGIGTQLLAPVLDRCDREGYPAMLDTYVVSSRAWYEALGFDIACVIELGPDAPSGWTMVRRPHRDP